MSLLLLFAGIGTGGRLDKHDGGYVKLTAEELRRLLEKIKRFQRSKNRNIEERKEQEQDLRQSLERAVYGVEEQATEAPQVIAALEAVKVEFAQQPYNENLTQRYESLETGLRSLQKAVANYLAEIERQDEEDIEFLLMSD